MTDRVRVPRELRGLNFNHLYLFHVVAKSPTLTAAAQALRPSPSSVSAQVRELEGFMGAALFNRSPGAPLELSTVGQRVLQKTEVVFDTAAQMMHEIRPTLGDDDTRGVLRLGVASTLSEAMASVYLTPLLREGSLRPVIRSGASRELVDALVRDELHLVLAHDAPLQLSTLGLVSRALATSAYSVVVGTKMAARIHDYPNDLADLPMIRSSTDSMHRNAEEVFLDNAQIEPRVLAETDSVSLALTAVSQDLAFAILPEQACLPCLGREEIVSLETLKDPEPRMLGIYREQTAAEVVEAALRILTHEAD